MSAVAKKERKVFTVSRLNQEVQQLLESGFGTVWLQGELSNFSKPASGHFYFSLKDSQAQIRCAMFRGRNQYIDFEPSAGDKVLVRGKLGLYAARGDFQLIVEHMEPAGAGQLQALFEENKAKLKALGWFDADTKLPIPPVPRTIGIVTSPTGAAIRDALQVLKRRYPSAGVVIYPTLVQGAQAAPAIATMLDRASARNEVDVVLLIRGGGSLEDLWAFNELTVAEAIRRCTIPIISGVGHEVDVTISDWVADLRAPTPSVAAEQATPDGEALAHHTNAVTSALYRLVSNSLTQTRELLNSLQQRLDARHPTRLLNERSQRVDELEQRVNRAFSAAQQKRSFQLQTLEQRLELHSPAKQLAEKASHLDRIARQLNAAAERRMVHWQTRLQLASHALNTVSPLATLDRGFAMVKRGDTVVRSVVQVGVGDTIVTRHSDGELEAQVAKIRPISENK
ncbi:MAG: exodeoxyribonuclease VII large subunit [Gammaproteobacteria bacterium]|nr:exodeoxyribonuclease VII large subunit [Gammaproteobacteria bacterium]